MTRSLVVVLATCVLAVAAAGCAGSDGSTGSGSAGSTGSGSAGSAGSGSAGRTGSRSAGEASRTVDVARAGTLTWGEGDYGVVLAHGAAFDAASWEDHAIAIADQGATVVAVEDIDTGSIAAAVADLQAGGIAEVALVGGSAGADAILRLVAEQPDLADQLVLLSPNTVVEGLGPTPKLFIASEDEPGADIPHQLAVANPDGTDVLLVPGSAHAQNVFDTDQGPVVLDAMLQRLDRGQR